jgi:hypothetical protein
MRRTLRWTRRSLFAGAAILLGYCTIVAADAWVFEQRESRNVQRLLEDDTVGGRLPAMAARGLIDPGTGEMLTLVTCYPFHSAAAAPDRFTFAPKEYIHQHNQGREA